MGTGIAGVPCAHSSGTRDSGSDPSSQVWKFRKQKTDDRITRLSNNSAERRAFALNARIEDLLHAVTKRVADRLKNERPEFSACTLKTAIRLIPLVFGAAAMLAMVSATSTALLCLLTALPSAFRILVAVHRPASTIRNSSPDFSPTTDREMPVYTVIAALHR